MIISDLRN